MTTRTESVEGTLLDWLRDAHAMEKHAEQMLSNTASRLEHYPELRAKIERHLEQTRSQAERLQGCIERHGGSTSVFKDTAAQVLGFGQALTGVFTSDEVVKASVASFAFEQMEMATYKALITAAESAGDLTTKEVCQEILAEEKEMAGWLDENLPGVVRTFLARDARGATAKR
ncbi:ferritin-like domain-containing protein [Rhodoplanes sp. SY1]|uniref:ferritin-like domain-containing protein n=1 Tax=Rhodoplanes sp. SY1 TaxID=3166646 RepID=UPI0038B5E1D8